MVAGDTTNLGSAASAHSEALLHSRVTSQLGKGIVESDFHKGKVSMIELPAGSLINYKAVFHDELGAHKNVILATAAHTNHRVTTRWEAVKEFLVWCAANAPWEALELALKAWNGNRADIRNAAKGCLEGLRQVAESNSGLSRVMVGSGDCVCGYILGSKIDAVQFGSANPNLGGLIWAKEQIDYNYNYLNTNVWHRNIRNPEYRVGIAVGCRPELNEDQRVNAQLDLWKEGDDYQCSDDDSGRTTGMNLCGKPDEPDRKRDEL